MKIKKCLLVSEGQNVDELNLDEYHLLNFPDAAPNALSIHKEIVEAEERGVSFESQSAFSLDYPVDVMGWKKIDVQMYTIDHSEGVKRSLPEIMYVRSNGPLYALSVIKQRMKNQYDIYEHSHDGDWQYVETISTTEEKVRHFLMTHMKDMSIRVYLTPYLEQP